jgi:methyl acetate hydrolase
VRWEPVTGTPDVMRRAGSGAWAGLCNTHFWVDRTTGITGVISQFLPFVPQDALEMYADFDRALYASL